MGWDINYEHKIEKIDDSSTPNINRWKFYKDFIKSRFSHSDTVKSHNTKDKKSEKKQKVIEKLKEIDRRVRAHEMAHLIAGGPYIKGGPYYKYITGPDGKRYAVAGEVKIDTSEEKDPDQTIKKMETVKRAALAPANPSPTDRQVAAEAAAKEAKARAKLMKEKMQKFRKNMEKYTFPLDDNKEVHQRANLNASSNPHIIEKIDIKL